MDNTRGAPEESYDKIAQGQKSGNKFKFESLQLAINETQTTIDYARKVTEAAYGTREAIRQLSQAAGDYGSWMAFPSEGRGTIDKMETSNRIQRSTGGSRSVRARNCSSKSSTKCTRWRARQCNKGVPIVAVFGGEVHFN